MDSLILARIISVDSQTPQKPHISGKRRLSHPSYLIEANIPPRRKGVHFPISVLLQQAITEGDTAEIGQFIKEYDSQVVEEREPSGLPPVMRAIFEGQLDCLKMLVHNGARLTTTDPEGWNVLHVAAAMDDMQAARFVTQTCNVPLTHIRNTEGERPIDLAESPEMASFLLHSNLQDLRIETDLSGKTRDANEDTMLQTVRQHYEANGNCDLLNVMLQSQSDFNSILHLAAGRNYPRLARYILKNHLVDPNNRNKRTGWTPIHLATYYGSIDVLILLLECGALVQSLTNAYEKSSDLTDVEVILDILKRHENNHNV